MKEARWRRYGHDRTYFKSDDGRDIGWIDNVTGERHGFTGPSVYETGRSTGDSSRVPRTSPGRGRPGATSDTGARALARSLQGFGVVARLAYRASIVVVVVYLLAVIAHVLLSTAGKDTIASGKTKAAQSSVTP